MSVLEFRKVCPDMTTCLSTFFRDLKEVGDDRLFHPHPFTDEEAARVAGYTGKDLYYVAIDETQVLAYGMLRGWDEGYEIPSLGIALHPSARGTGLAVAFMRFLHSAARRKGAQKIRLKVYSDNVKAVRLYENLNYVFGTEKTGQLIGIVDLI